MKTLDRGSPTNHRLYGPQRAINPFPWDVKCIVGEVRLPPINKSIRTPCHLKMKRYKACNRDDIDSLVTRRYPGGLLCRVIRWGWDGISLWRLESYRELFVFYIFFYVTYSFLYIFLFTLVSLWSLRYIQFNINVSLYICFNISVSTYSLPYICFYT